MTRLSRMRPEFVEFIPGALDEGVLYLSEEYGTASHACACGCGMRVVTPLAPTFWKIVREKDGSVSLFPSIGNHDYPCGSHYWIQQNKIVWAPAWSKSQIEAARESDRLEKAAYYDTINTRKAWYTRILEWFGRWLSS